MRVYKSDADGLKDHNSTPQTIIQALLNLEEEDAFDLVREIRSCDNLDAVAAKIAEHSHGANVDGSSPLQDGVSDTPTFETQLYGKMGDLRLDGGSVRHIGGTSNLIYINQDDSEEEVDEYPQHEDPVSSWTTVTDDADLVLHLLNMYFTWHYTYFTTLSKTLFYRDFLLGKPPPNTKRKTHYCTELLVNAMLALGCHFTSRNGARENPADSATAGDHFFKEAKRLIMENDEHERPRLTTVQALALMSVREAGCAREAKGWVYSGMSFRMACDMGLNLNTGQLTTNKHINGDEAEEDVRRVTFWGCFLFDKCWSNYLGRLPQLPLSIITAPKYEVFPNEDSTDWLPYSDSGFSQAHSQPARTRAVALQISKLCEISNDLMSAFYSPTNIDKGKAAELKMLSSIHTRLEAWRRHLPKEMEPHEGCLSSVLTMHMFSHLLFIHLFRPFLKYNEATSPLPPAVSPGKLCTQAAQMVSKLMRLYKRSYGLRQICNIVVYIAHSACTIHLLNLPDKLAKRDIVHGLKHLEEIAEGWLCARRTLAILSILVKKWKIELPEEAVTVLARTDGKFGPYTKDFQSPSAQHLASEMSPCEFASQAAWQNSTACSANSGLLPAVLARQDHDSHAPQAHEANIPRAQQPYQPASATPQQNTRSSTDILRVTSPSDMFGNTEQLLRDGQDWIYYDQASYGAGFENWTEMDINPATWANSVMPGDGLVDAGTGGGTMCAALAAPTTQPAAYTQDDSNAANSNVTDWLNGGNPFYNMPTYNEQDWYQ
ncbi:hypothetical protein LTR37_003325 [Vermiconidia calcicola]|uniref:Uncharacterized protein n=1 Tax=Vermiconidia calcicola TaxID=1690605 RepID=A0ACC3NPY9_9PEZI|nr:hypothetical protein LTR37_003325 [Vermiconidia calcicola]